MNSIIKYLCYHMLSFQHNIKLSTLKNPLLKSKFLFFVKERNEIVRESSNKKIPMDLILILIATLFVLLGLIGSVLRLHIYLFSEF